MPTNRFLSLCCVGAAWAMLAGCSSSPISRIDANRAEYETWPLEMKQAVLDGRVEKGMNPKMVEVAIGKPTEVEERAGRSGMQVVWVYRRGGSTSLLPSNTTWSVGTGGVGVGTSGGGGNRSSTAAEEYTVVFENGVVVDTDYPLPGSPS